MKQERRYSLKRKLIIRLLAFQVGLLALFGLFFVSFLVQADEGGVLISPEFARTAVQAIERGQDGQLHIRETPKLIVLRDENIDFWFVARSDLNETITFGNVPDAYRILSRNLDRVTFADIRDTTQPFRYLAIIRRISGPAGTFTVLGKGSLFSTAFVVTFFSNLLMFPILGLLALITIVTTPLIVRRAFNTLSIAADEAGRIDVDRRGVRLSPTGIPAEIVPLVEAINGALQRLDEGYERQERFIADAAHEMRTPIAILQAKIEASAGAIPNLKLQRDIARLATLAEQLLDLQRIDRIAFPCDVVRLGLIAQNVVADLAPLVIADGGELELIDLGGAEVRGDANAIERVVANLIQNALEHGGRTIIVRIDGAVVEVEDNGAGIPVAERERVFGPFYRLSRRGTGSGLGLNLVRQVMHRHGGHVAAVEPTGGGTIIRLEFVAATQG